MKIGIANDHHGVDLKKRIISYLEKNNISYINYGCDEKDNIDYIDYAVKLCTGINNKECDLGILICGTGIGMSIVANKIPGIICGKVNTKEEARLIKEHNLANVMSLSEYTEDLENILHNFIYTEYSKEERHIRRNKKIKELEKKYE